MGVRKISPVRLIYGSLIAFCLVAFQAAAFAQGDSVQSAPDTPSAVTDSQPATAIPTQDTHKWITASAHSPVKIAVSPGKACALKVDLGMHRLMASSSAGDTLFSLSLDSPSSRPLPFASFNSMTIDNDDDKIFATTDDQAVMVLDRKSLVKIDRILLPGHCGAAVYVPSCRRVLVAHQTGVNVWSIDAKLHTLGLSSSLNGPVSDMIYDSGTDKVMALCPSTSQIAVIDPWTMTVTSYWGLASKSAITSLGADGSLGVVFTGDANGTLTVLDSHTGLVLGSVTLGTPITSMTYDASAQQIFCLSSDQGEVEVVQLARGGGVIDLGQIETITGLQSAAVIRGTTASNLWVSFSDPRGSYLQCYTVML